MKPGVLLICLCCLPIVSYCGDIVGYTTDVSNGKTNIVTVTVKDNNMNTNPHAQQVDKIIAPKVERPKLHMAELLSYVTVRLSCVKNNGASYGTGFFYDIPHVTNPTMHIPVIVSNRHVAKDVQETSVVFTLAGADSLPSSEKYTLRIDNRAFPWINHPDASVDLSVLPLAPALRHMEKQGKKPFFFAFNSSYIPDEGYMKSITQTDEVVMIGYPGGLWDDVNNQPIFRKGILATSPSKNFGGRREFLIDMPVYWGSSGSPVLLFSEGAYYDRGCRDGAHGLMAGGRLKLLGINYATITSTVTGKVVPVPVPTVVEDMASTASGQLKPEEQRFSLEAKMGIPNNIGIIIHASRLKEIEEMFANIVRNLPNGGAKNR